jgi:hypothetical protein
MAYMIFDRTGAICAECSKHYERIKVIQASPVQTSFEVDEYRFTVGQTSSHATLLKAGHDPKDFGKVTKHFFEVILRLLEVKVITRIGLRQSFYEAFVDSEEAVEIFKSFSVQPGSGTVLSSESRLRELELRWESDDYGVMFHVGSIPGNIAFPMSDVTQYEKDFGQKYKSAVIFDVDLYTIKPVLLSQWSSEEWIASSSHTIKKGIRSFLT